MCNMESYLKIWPPSRSFSVLLSSIRILPWRMGGSARSMRTWDSLKRPSTIPAGRLNFAIGLVSVSGSTSQLTTTFTPDSYRKVLLHGKSTSRPILAIPLLGIIWESFTSSSAILTRRWSVPRKRSTWHPIALEGMLFWQTHTVGSIAWTRQRPLRMRL